MSEKLTVKEAIEQGYTHFGFADQEFQHLLSIATDLNVSTFKKKVCLFGKEPSSCASISREEIADMLADHMSSSVGEDTGDDDTDDIYDIIIKLDFGPCAEMINSALSHKKYYSLTKIELIP